MIFLVFFEFPFDKNRYTALELTNIGDPWYYVVSTWVWDIFIISFLLMWIYQFKFTEVYKDLDRYDALYKSIFDFSAHSQDFAIDVFEISHLGQPSNVIHDESIISGDVDEEDVSDHLEDRLQFLKIRQNLRQPSLSRKGTHLS